MGYELNYAPYGLRVEQVAYYPEVEGSAASNTLRRYFYHTIVPHGLLIQFYDPWVASDSDYMPRFAGGVGVSSYGALRISSGTVPLFTPIEDTISDAGPAQIWIPRTSDGVAFYQYENSGYELYSTTYCLDAGGTGAVAFSPFASNGSRRNVYCEIQLPKASGTAGSGEDWGKVENVSVYLVYTTLPPDVTDLSDEEVSKLDGAAEKFLFGIGATVGGNGFDNRTHFI